MTFEPNISSPRNLQRVFRHCSSVHIILNMRKLVAIPSTYTVFTLNIAALVLITQQRKREKRGILTSWSRRIFSGFKSLYEMSMKLVYTSISKMHDHVSEASMHHKIC